MYYLHRDTPLHDWQVTLERYKKGGEWIELPECHWFNQAQAEADRLNGKQDGGQEVLPI